MIFSLLFLLTMTLLGVSAMGMSNLQNIIATNAQMQTSALNATEVQLRSGERDIETIVTDGSTMEFNDSGDHYYVSGDIDPTDRDWSFDTNGNLADGQYVIEYAGSRKLPTESRGWGSTTAGDTVYLFLVGAQKETGKGARRTTQTVYVTQDEP